jgi:hypothetical protein
VFARIGDPPQLMTVDQLRAGRQWQASTIGNTESIDATPIFFARTK